LEQGRARPALENGEESRRLVGGGVDALAAQRIRIVDPESGNVCRDDQIGEIQLGGPSISLGYWQNPAATARAFTGGADGSNRWLRTGDLGFIEDGELFVSGRLKDLIIIRGRNYYPHDLEYAVEAATDALNPGGVAAFAVSGGDGEKLAVLAELKRNRLRQPGYQAEFAAIRARLAEECGIQADTVMLLKPGTLLKTSSGKIRRAACRESFEQRLFKAVAMDKLDKPDKPDTTDGQSVSGETATTAGDSSAVDAASGHDFP
jgi:acyl-CoA synthetase (AMP-forming)/AMP-acid ligase II